MNNKHARTIAAIFRTPTLGGIVFADIEGLIVAMSGETREGSGSRVAFELFGQRRYMHRPHPGKEARRYQVEALREWFIELGVQPC